MDPSSVDSARAGAGIRLRLSALAVATVAAALSLPGVAGADTPSDSARTAGSELIVRFKSDATPAQRERARSDADTSLKRRLRLPHTQLLSIEDGSVSAAVRELDRRDDVEYAEPNRVYRALAPAPNDPRYGDLWGMTSVRSLDAWDTTRGSGQIVAVVDTGVSMSHADLSAGVWQNPGQAASGDGDGNGKAGDAHGWDFVNNDADPTDQNSHGTHVAGTVAATAGNGVGVAGVAPAARVMPVRVLDANGSGSTSAIANGVTYAAAEGARTINLSLGGSGASRTFSAAIDYARSKGAVVIVAAGNSSANNDGANPEYPCAYPQANIVCVASIDRNGAMSSFSSYGARTVDVAAPGGSILSTVPSGYAYYSGTSMATPHVSGIAALVAAAKPATSADGVAAAIRSGVVGQSNLRGRVASGGHADAPLAIQTAGGPAAPPSRRAVAAPASLRTTPPRRSTRSACSGLHGRKLRRCKVELKVQRTCGRKHGRSRRICAKRVRAMARCTTLKHGTRAQRQRRSSCMREARAIGRKHHRR